MKQPITSTKSNEERVMRALKNAGVSEYGLHRFTSTYLPRVIHPDENIEAAVFGRMKESEGFFGFVEGLLVATDKRVIFIDHRPGYTTMDEVTYDVVSGVNISTTIFYSSVTLFTKVANYRLSFANKKSVQRFADYIESRRIDTTEREEPIESKPYVVLLSNEALQFLTSHEIGVLSSTERTGLISGAVVYYTVRGNGIYFMTKVGTRKADNILGNQHVAFTVYDELKLQTVQLHGVVELETDELIKKEVAESVIRLRSYENGKHLPPIMKMGGKDEFVTFRITPTKYSYTDFKNLSV
ncbi:MAG: PH domain-containing protein [Candidatus Nomurabacteria bacterium]|nr:MAG: PH domain-containing protein [Candidatus Nomurabacteria bacterium]